MGWITFEITISILEMLTSCFFATGIFQKELKGRRDVLELILYSVGGAILMTLREYVFLWIPDFVPTLVVYISYAIMVCCAKWWVAMSWALMNYLFIGIVSIAVTYSLKIAASIPIEAMELGGSMRVLVCIFTRLGQLLLSEIILLIMKRFSRPAVDRQKDWKIIVVSSASIAMLWYVWMMRLYANNDLAGHLIILICILTLAMNFTLFIFDEIIAKEKSNEEELKTQNRLMVLQVRSQDEMNNMYQNVLRLKHDMNNHLHTISGYLQVGEYGRAQKYIEDIVGEISGIESFYSGNVVVDALVGSKTALAKMNKIPVKVGMALPSDIKIEAGHLTVLLGNLYDNAIDANLKIKDTNKRFIHIKINYANENLFLLFENAAQDENKSSGINNWTTTKKESFLHGFGIKNIDRIVQIYGGYCERELKNQVFVCRIRIPDIDLNYKSENQLN